MKSINAMSLTHNVNEWLESSYDPRILHVFDKACNLINERGEVLSIVTSQIGDGPFNLVVEEKSSFWDDYNYRSSVSLSPARLMIGDNIIHTADATLWSPRPNWEVLHLNRNKIAGCVADLQITDQFNVSFGGDAGIMPIARSLASTFSLALVNADFSSALEATSQLAGLGIGLTPSGDDFIMGAIYVVWIIHPPEVADMLAREIANIAAPLTTSLSAAWLKAAGEGEAGRVWHDFFDALVSSDLPRIRQTMNDILAVGETSGADALAGFARVLASWMEKVDSSHE